MTGSLDPDMARFTSLIDAAGPSPSSIVKELEARNADQEEEGRGPWQDLERRHQEFLASERREGLEEGVGGSAITTITNDNSLTNADEQASPSVSGLREEERYLRDRVKMYDGLTQQLLRFIDGRQTAADENIRRLEETLVTCNVSYIYSCSFGCSRLMAADSLAFLLSGYSGGLNIDSIALEQRHRD